MFLPESGRNIQRQEKLIWWDVTKLTDYHDQFWILQNDTDFDEIRKVGELLIAQIMKNIPEDWNEQRRLFGFPER